MEQEKGQVRKIETFDDWRSNVEGTIDFKRADGSIDRFTCRGLTGKEIDEMNDVCKYPKVPLVPKINGDGTAALSNGMALTEPNDKDPEYLKTIKEMDEKRVFMIIEKGLVKPCGKDIPGKDWKEKLDYLNTKLRGDVNKLGNFIQLRLSNLQSADIPFFD